MKIWVDPPSGWRYEFPKIFDPKKDGDIMGWMVSSGYPREEIEKLGTNFYWRAWEAENNDSDFKKGIRIKQG